MSVSGNGSGTVPCIGCGACMARCPMELDIPALLRLWNEYACTIGFVPPEALKGIPEDKGPGACIRCRYCERTCPRRIRIPAVLSELTGMLG